MAKIDIENARKLMEDNLEMNKRDLGFAKTVRDAEAVSGSLKRLLQRHAFIAQGINEENERVGAIFTPFDYSKQIFSLKLKAGLKAAYLAIENTL